MNIATQNGINNILFKKDGTPKKNNVERRRGKPTETHIAEGLWRSPSKTSQDRQAVGELEITKKEESLLLCSKKTKKKVKVAKNAKFFGTT